MSELNTAGEEVFRPMSCECGLTGGCEKCRPAYTHQTWEISMGVEKSKLVPESPTYITLPSEVARLMYFRIMAVARARAKDDVALYGELVDAVLPLRRLVTSFGHGAENALQGGDDE